MRDALLRGELGISALSPRVTTGKEQWQDWHHDFAVNQMAGEQSRTTRPRWSWPRRWTMSLRRSTWTPAGARCRRGRAPIPYMGAYILSKPELYPLSAVSRSVHAGSGCEAAWTAWSQHAACG